MGTFNVIDSDGHILEPPTLWVDFIEPKYRDRAPIVFEEGGKDRFAVDGKVVSGPNGIGTAGAIKPPGDTSEVSGRYLEGRLGGFDPDARIKDLDIDGIDAVFLYPSLGLLAGAVEDPGLAAATARAYNRWIVTYTEAHPDRLFGVAMLPMQDIELAVEELKFARSELGLGAAFVRPNPYNNRTLSDPAYDVLWSTAEDLDVSIGVHEGTGGGIAAGLDRVPPGHGARHIVSHTVEMMLASLNIIWGGVCERHPRLRFAFLESGGGWMASWLDRMDRHFEDRGSLSDTPCTMRPSEYFRRQCWISFEPNEGTLPFLVDYLGANKILWATDYPHVDGYFPGAPGMVTSKLPSDVGRTVLSQGAIEFYNIEN